MAAPLVFIPGLQGRWEYMQRTVDALRRSCTVVTFSLADEPISGFPFDPARGMDNYIDQIDREIDRAGLPAAAICGVSFGGIIALAYAARRPERTTALILTSTPGPGWHLKPAHRLYARHPRILAPFFFIGMPGRLRRELLRAYPLARDRWAFVWRQARTFVRAPVSPSRMGARALIADRMDFERAAARVSAPTLVITGDPDLDHIVPAAGTASYASAIHSARLARLEDTGHLGSFTRPDEFAAIVTSFLTSVNQNAA